MLRGQPPFTGPPETLPYQHVNLAPRPIRELRPTASASLDTALARLLAKVPADGFESGAALVAALAPSAQVHPPTPVRTRTRGVPLRGVWVGVALAAVALVIA